MLVTPTPAGDGSGLVSSPTEETTLSPSSPALVGPTSAAPPPPLAKSILKRRATHPDKQPDQANGSAHSGKDKDKSLWFEGKRIRFSSLGSPGGSRPPDLYDDGPGQATQPATGGGVWLDEDTRKQMALMGQGLGRRKRKDRDGEPEGEGPPAAMSSTSAAELELVGSLAKKINNFTRESQEWSDLLRPLLGPPGSASSSRRQSVNADYSSSATQSPSAMPSAAGAVMGSPSRPTIPPLGEVLNSPSPLHEPSSLPHHPTFPSSLLRRQSAPEALLRSSAAATLASFAANATTHDRRRPSFIGSPSPVHLPHPPSPLSHSYLLSNTHGGPSQTSAPSSPHAHPIVDPSLHLPPIRSSPASVPSTPLPYARPSHPLHSASVPASLPTRRTSTVNKTPDSPSALHLLNQLRRHSTPASPAVLAAQGTSGPAGSGGGGAKDLLRRFSTIMKERVETWEGIEELVKDAEEVRREWDQGMAMV